MATEKEVEKKSNVLANLEVVLTLTPDDMKELKTHEQLMLEMQSLLNP